MYVFATAAFLGLGVMVFARVFDRYLGALHEHRAFVGAGLGVLAAWLADYDLFARWGQPMREEWIGLLLTGLALGGLAHVFHELTDMIAGFARKTNDEAEAIERGRDLRAA